MAFNLNLDISDKKKKEILHCMDIFLSHIDKIIGVTLFIYLFSNLKNSSKLTEFNTPI